MSGGFRISPPITFFDGHVSSFGRRASLYPRIKNLPVDLIISGHLHGGIIRLPFIGGIIGDEEKRILPDYTSGVYKEGDDAAECAAAAAITGMIGRVILNPYAAFAAYAVVSAAIPLALNSLIFIKTDEFGYSLDLGRGIIKRPGRESRN